MTTPTVPIRFALVLSSPVPRRAPRAARAGVSDLVPKPVKLDPSRWDLYIDRPDGAGSLSGY